jgi:hypothetical protein
MKRRPGAARTLIGSSPVIATLFKQKSRFETGPFNFNISRRRIKQIMKQYFEDE